MDIVELGMDVDSRPLNKTNAEMNRFVQQGKRVDGAARGVEKSTGVMAAGMKRAALAIGATVAAMASFGAGVRTLAQFEKQMSTVGAVSRATTAEMQAMRDVAADLGSTTEFTAKQAGEGLEFLARAGFSAAESVKAIPAVLDLATAAAIGLGNAADISSNIMSAFGIAAGEAASVADVLAAASSRANTDVQQLGDAMSFVGPVASSLGIEMSAAAAAIGVLSDAGIQGSSAGTGLRRVLSSLANPTKEAADTLASLGLQMETLNPQTNDLTSIIEQLAGSGLSAADALTIFGDRGGPAILALTSQTGRLEELTGALTDVGGEATRMADTMRDNLGGDIDGLVSSTQGLIIALGEAGLTAVIRAVVQSITNITRGITGLVQTVDGAIDATARFGRAVLGISTAEEIHQQAMDNVTRAMGDQIRASEALRKTLSGSQGLTLDVIEAKIEEARARRENVRSLVAERQEAELSALGYENLLTRIENTRELMNALAPPGTDIEQMSRNIRGSYEDLEKTLASLIRRQREMLDSVRERNHLTEEEQRNLEQIEANLAVLRAKQQAWNSDAAETVTLSDRVRLSIDAASQSLGLAWRNAQGLAGGLSQASAQASALSSFLSSLPGALAGAKANIAGLQAGISTLAAGGDEVAASVAEYRAQLEATLPPLRTMQDGQREFVRNQIEEKVKLFEQEQRLRKEYTDQVSALNQVAAAAGGGGGGGGSAGSVAKGMEDAAEKTATFASTLQDAAMTAEEMGVERANILISGIDSIAGAFGDFVADGFRNFKGFVDSVWSSFKSLISDMIALAVRNRIMISLGITAGGAGTAAAAGGAGGSGGGLLSSLMGGGGGGMLGTLGSAAAGTVGTGFIGAAGNALGIGRAAFNPLAIGKAAEMAGGGFMATLGAALPLIAGVGLVIGLFSKKVKELDKGVRVTVDGMDALVETFRKTESSRLFGLLKSRSTDYDSASAEIADPITSAVRQVQTSIMDTASVLGIGAEAFEGFSHRFKVSLKGLSKDEQQAAISDALGSMGDEFAAMALGSMRAVEREVTERVATGRIYGQFERGRGNQTYRSVTRTVTEMVRTTSEFAREGETATETLERLANALIGVNRITDMLGHQMFEASLAGADMASSLAEAFGGLQAMDSATTTFFNAFYSEAEQLAAIGRRAADALAEHNLRMPQTRDQYRAMVEAMDLTTQGGREAYATLVGLADSFDRLLPAMSGVTQLIEGLIGNTSSAVDVMISEARNMARDAGRAAQDWFRAAGSLRDFLRDLTGSQASALTPGQQFRATHQNLRQTFMAARGGDVDAARDFPGVARDFLRLAQAQASTALEFRRIESRVRSQANMLAGIAELEGANQTIIEALAEKQIEVLENLSEYLKTGTIEPEQLRDFESQLKDLQGAIEQAEMFSYDYLKERLKVTVDVLADADIPDHMKALLQNAEEGVESYIEFAVRAEELTPEMRWLAVTRASDHLKRVQFQVETGNLGAAERSLLQAVAGNFSGTVRLAGDVQFDPSTAFEETTISNIRVPMEKLTDSIRMLIRWTKIEGLRAQFIALTQQRVGVTDYDEKARIDVARLRFQQGAQYLNEGVPVFASGGLHTGGLRVVGEQGPELEATGPARYYSASETRAMLGNDPRVMAELLREVKQMRSEQRQLGLRTDRHEKRTAEILRKWDAIGLPQEQI